MKINKFLDFNARVAVASNFGIILEEGKGEELWNMILKKNKGEELE